MRPDEETHPFLGYTDDPHRPPNFQHQQQTPTARNTTTNHRRDALVFLLSSLLWALIVILLFFASPSSPPPPPHPAGSEDTSRSHNITSNAHLITCGASPAAARAAGCRYDTLLNHWVPAPCLDQEWVDEYQDDGSWAAYTDVNLTQRLKPEEMGQVDQYYTSIRDHVNHCAMLWRKQFWTLFEGRRVFDAVIVNGYHTDHCAQFLAEAIDMVRTEPTLVKVGFSGCWVRESNES